MKSIKNIKDLRDSLLTKYSEFDGNNEKSVIELSTITACAYAIIRSAKTEMDYKKLKKDDTDIEFLNTKHS